MAKTEKKLIANNKKPTMTIFWRSGLRRVLNCTGRK